VFEICTKTLKKVRPGPPRVVVILLLMYIFYILNKYLGSKVYPFIYKTVKYQELTKNKTPQILNYINDLDYTLTQSISQSECGIVN